jgi:Rrf2 family protein
MNQDSRLSRMLHVLLHMARHDRPFTSEQIARMLRTNAVVVRRTLAGLRNAGLVQSEKGHGGGWTITRDLNDITLLDVHRALGSPRVFAMGNDSANPECAVEAVVNVALDDAFQRAESLLVDRFAEVSLASLARDFDQRCVAGGWGTEPPAEHG